MVPRNSLLADETESSLSEYSEDDQGQLYKIVKRNESVEPGDSGRREVSELKNRSSKALDDLMTVIDALLDVDTRKSFVNTMNQIAWFGNRKSTTLAQRREKLREIVAQNGRIRSLYNEYARLFAESEKRNSYQLPLFDEMNEPAAEKQQSESQTERLGEEVAIMTQAEAATPAPGCLQSPVITSTISDMQNEDEEHSLSESRCAILPITNPEAFPIARIQEVQAQRYPSTQIIAMWSHRDANGIITQVTADVNKGSIDHLIIRNPRIITALGVHKGAQDTIIWDDSGLKLDETFIVRAFPLQRWKNSKAWIAGELESARHAYLYWLDHRRSVDPKTAPYAQEARIIAKMLGRRAPHVFSEIMTVWEKERGPYGRRYRENRLRYLGEDPSYAQEAEGQVFLTSMWG